MTLEKKESEGTEASQRRKRLEAVILLETKLGELFFEICSKLSKRIKSFQVKCDDSFVHRRDRESNDIHAFLELNDGTYFHLRAYIRHMLDSPDNLEAGQVFLTGYRKDGITQTGGTHSFRQDWYNWDADTIVEEIVGQNEELFK